MGRERPRSPRHRSRDGGQEVEVRRTRGDVDDFALLQVIEDHAVVVLAFPPHRPPPLEWIPNHSIPSRDAKFRDALRAEEHVAMGWAIRGHGVVSRM